MARLLIIEDHAKLVATLRQGFQEEGFEVATAGTGAEGLRLGLDERPDAIILDWMLPDGEGIGVLRQLRALGCVVPIVMLTARDAIADRVHGLESGADDYLVKPFAFAELLARVRVLLRRSASAREVTLRAEALEMDLVGRRVTRGGQTIELTKREFELLEYLLRHKNTSVTRAMLARDVWKETDDSLAMATNVIEVCINVLRRKVELPGQPRLIHTVRGVGYSLKEPTCDD
jgi:DNA-binding response OmpR family regulator